MVGRLAAGTIGLDHLSHVSAFVADRVADTFGQLAADA
jgi:hypothetical protein